MFIFPSEEDYKRGKKIPKDHCWRITEDVAWGYQVTKTTIRHKLHGNKLFGRHARKKPFLSFHHKRKCLDFANRYLNFDWNRVSVVEN